jgi:hypothetical protein
MIETIKSLRWIDYYFFALVDPRKLATHIIRGVPSPLPLSLIAVAMAAFIEIMTSSILGIQTPYFYYKITYGWILLFIVTLLIIIILSSLIDLTSQFLGYSGNVRVIISLMGFSLLPKTLLLPMVYIFRIFHFAPLFFYVFLSVFLFIWSAIIIILGISEINNISFSKSFMVFIFPFLLIGGIVFFIVFLIIVNIIAYISIA